MTPGVGSRRDEDVPESEWESYWVPFVEDFRGTPERLIHPECFAEERELAALVREERHTGSHLVMIPRPIRLLHCRDRASPR